MSNNGGGEVFAIILEIVVYVLPIFLVIGNESKKSETKRKNIEKFKSLANENNPIADQTSTIDTNFFTYSNEYCSLSINDCTKKIFIAHQIDSSDIQQFIYHFKDISKVELEIDGKSQTSSTVSNAIIGGVLLGGIGALAGAVNASKKVQTLTLKIFVNDLKTPYHELLFFHHDISLKTDNPLCAPSITAIKDWYSRILYIIESNNKQSDITSSQTNHCETEIEALQKALSLYNEGVLSKDEFEKLKEKILNK